MRKRCFPDLPATKCAVSDALLSRKGRPQRNGSYKNQTIKALRDNIASPIYALHVQNKINEQTTKAQQITMVFHCSYSPWKLKVSMQPNVLCLFKRKYL